MTELRKPKGTPEGGQWAEQHKGSSGGVSLNTDQDTPSASRAAMYAWGRRAGRARQEQTKAAAKHLSELIRGAHPEAALIRVGVEAYGTRVVRDVREVYDANGNSLATGYYVGEGIPEEDIYAATDCLDDHVPGVYEERVNSNSMKMEMFVDIDGALAAPVADPRTSIHPDVDARIREVTGTEDYAPYVLDGQDHQAEGWNDVLVLVDEGNPSGPRAVKFTRNPEGEIDDWWY